jgi:hypothetical protein
VGTEDPLHWIHKCEQFFRAQQTSKKDRVWLATYHLEGVAQQWYYMLKQNMGSPTWKEFIKRISTRFGPTVRSNPLGDLSHLQFSDSIEDYQDQFLILLARCEGLREEHQIHLFTA